MKISKELIEKYHDGHCTPDEKKAVEAWLFDDETPIEPIVPIPTGDDKTRLQDDMWNEISTVLPSSQKNPIVVFFRPVWRQVAAILLVSLVGLMAYLLTSQDGRSGVVVAHNVSETVNKDLHESAYSLSLGPKSNVAIHNETGRIDFCGAMLINPKRDMEVTFQGACTRPDDKTEKMVLKKGQQYIALNYGNDPNNNEVLIFSPGSLTGLPPVMQRQLMMQFNI